MHIHALVADADLAAILEARQHGRANGCSDVGILGDDEGRLATELKPQQFEIFSSGTEDLLAGAHTAGERDETWDRMAHQRRTDAFAGAADDIDHARREVELRGEL